MFKDIGKGEHLTFPLDNNTSPRDITQSFQIDDSLHLFNSTFGVFYIYNQNSKRFQKLDKVEKLKLPCLIEREHNGDLLFLDKASILYQGKYENGTFQFSKRFDLSVHGVLESYFIKSSGNQILVGTNKGLFILTDRTFRVINQNNGLPDGINYSSMLKSGDIWYLGTSKGLFEVSLKKLDEIKPDYSLNLLTLDYDDFHAGFSPGMHFTIRREVPEVVISWELNAHPYPQNTRYKYKVNNERNWNQVLTPGKIILKNPTFGSKKIKLLIEDETSGNNHEVELLSIDFKKPFYKSSVFTILLVVSAISLLLFLYYRNRIKKLRMKEQLAVQESAAIRQKLEVLQFLLKPHFIFNSLTSIQNLILEKDFKRSLTYTSYFSKFLRGIIDTSGDELIPLTEELKNL